MKYTAERSPFNKMEMIIRKNGNILFSVNAGFFGSDEEWLKEVEELLTTLNK